MSNKYEDIVDNTAIAVIGMSGSFPGASDLAHLWYNVINGIESVEVLSKAEMSAAGVPEYLLQDPNYVRACLSLENIDCFDAGFFGISPREAALMDPQHRMLLEHAHAAFEDAGYVPNQFDFPVGVFTGIGLNAYLLDNVLANSGGTQWDLQVVTGNDKSYASTRIAYKLNLTGPCVSVDAACSTSLVAVHFACQALLAFECDMALAGASKISLPERQGYPYAEGSIYAADGHCKPFDEQASGTLMSSGVGTVLLKRLEDALQDGDHIHAVIRGSAVNNDGAQKLDYAAPSSDGQAAVIASALAIADVDPAHISYVETHGTGTKLGDPVELAGLRQVFKETASNREQPCYLGAIKANIGHPDVAAGMAGLLKTIMLLKNKKLPPMANFKRPNPQLEIEDSVFSIITEAVDWPKTTVGRLAGISSFGIGGTNAHLVVQEADSDIETTDREEDKLHLFPFSARDTEALHQRLRNTGHNLKERNSENLISADVAYTLQTGRQHFRQRVFLLADKVSQAADQLAHDSDAVLGDMVSAPDQAPPVLFMFPGQGSQYSGMTEALYNRFEVFKKTYDQCSDILVEHLGIDLRKAVFQEHGDINQTVLAQPALFSSCYALAKTWIAAGVKPSAMLGHSIGEYVAATLAGVFNLEDALYVVAQRGRLVQSLPAGGMLCVACDAQTAEQILQNEGIIKDCAIAVLNSPAQTVLAGTCEGIEATANRFKTRGIDVQVLETSHAFHSFMLEPVLDEFHKVVSKVDLQKPDGQFISNVTGHLAGQEILTPEYWVDQLRQPVKFSDGLQTLASNFSGAVFLDVGPRAILGGLIRQNLGRDVLVVSSMPHARQLKEGEERIFLQAVGRLWQFGVDFSWDFFYMGRKRTRVSLPSYPFARTRHWLDGVNQLTSKPNVITESRSLLMEEETSLFVPIWQQYMQPSGVSKKRERAYLVKGGDVAAQLVTNFRVRGLTAEHILVGEVASTVSSDEHKIHVASFDDEASLATMWRSITDWSDGREIHVIDCGLMNCELASSTADLILKNAFDQPVLLAKTAAEHNIKLKYTIIGQRIIRFDQTDKVEPVRAAILGPVRVIPQEYSAIQCCVIDLGEKSYAENGSLADAILEIVEDDFSYQSANIIALRNGLKWRRTLQVIKPEISSNQDSPSWLKTGGSYLFLGGTSALALKFMEHFFLDSGCHLLLCGRRTLPASTFWEKASTADPDGYGWLGVLAKLRSNGLRVEYQQLDVTDTEAVSHLLETEGNGFDGIFHFVGHPGDDLIATKSVPRNTSVFNSKLVALTAIEQWVHRNPDKHVLLASSVIAWCGGIGQVDYSAANNVLESFASNFPGCVQALVWDAWRDTGMNQGRESQLLFEQWFTPEHDGTRFQIDENCARSWPVAEHRISGVATMPGTAIVDCMLQIGCTVAGDDRIPILGDVSFLQPLHANSLRKSEILLEVVAAENKLDDKLDKQYRLSLTSLEGSRVHATALLSFIESTVLNAVEVLDIASSATIDALPAMASGELELGPHWQSLEALSIIDGTLHARLRLPQVMASDAANFVVNPAILDMAGLCGARLIDTSDAIYVPAGYEKVTVVSKLTVECGLQVVVATQNSDEVLLNAVFFDADGNSCVELDGLRMRVIRQSIRSPEAVGDDGAFFSMEVETALNATRAAMEFNQVPAVLISKGDPLIRAKALRDEMKAIASRKEVDSETLLVDASEHVDERVMVLAKIWGEKLGLTSIAIDDNFFELGGTSLTAMQIATSIREMLNIELDVKILFEYPTLDSLHSFLMTNTVISETESIAQPLVRAPVDLSIPLSLQQNRLWYLSSFEGGNASYNIPVAIALEGKLDFVVSRKALTRINERHQILRTSLVEARDQIIQKVYPAIAVAMPVIDLSGLKQQPYRAEYSRLLVVDGTTTFDLGQQPLWHVRMIRRSSQLHTLMLNLHHTIFDHWSVGLMVAEFARELRGEIIEAPMFQYRDYCYSQQLSLESGTLVKQQLYWQEKLLDAPDLLTLPTDYPRPDIQTTDGKDCRFTLDAELVTRLKQQAREKNVSLYILLLATFKYLLYRLSGETDLVVGTPVANRNQPELENMLGFFANTVAVYSQLNDEMRFDEWLDKVRDNALDAYANQDVDFEQVVDSLGRKRSLAYTPVFQVVFVLQNSPADEVPVPDLKMSIVEQHNNTAKFDIALSLYEQTDGGLLGALEYRSNLFSAETIKRWMKYFSDLLVQVVEQPDQLLTEFRLDDDVFSSIQNKFATKEIEEFIL